MKQRLVPIMPITLSFLLLMLAVPPFVNSAEISGKITDKTDGSGLVHAIVSIIPENSIKALHSVAADESGYYKLGNIPAGSYQLKVSYIGFTTWQKSDISIAADDMKTMNASLSPAAINLNSISVSASRSPEKLVDAPAAVSLLQSEEIEERTTLTATEHLKGLPGVDVSSTGLNQSNVVVRGFNNIFSGSMLVLTDNRIARVPSLRFNAYNFIPAVNADIERIEIVSGPGSALYGPNSANGVMHVITKSPFSSQGTTVSIGGGERDVAIGSIRHAGVLNDKVGYKFSAQYYQGNDWEHFEPIEPDSIALYRPTASGNDTVKATFASSRDFDIKKLSGEGRIDYYINDNTSLILNGGFNRASSIELTGLGAGQAIDWTYAFGQMRLNYKDLFIQTFVNASDAGDTYLLNTGQLIVDKSKLWVAQVQHSYKAAEKLSLTYGLDGLFTRPNTDSTINGRNEQADNINEYGVYTQADYQLHEKTKFVGAVRVDKNDQLEDLVFSPRAGIVYQPNSEHNFRFTYNKAFDTPDNNNLFLDILSAQDPFGVGAGFGAVLPFSPDIDIRVQGVPESGFHWSINGNGPQYRSSFAPLVPGMTNRDFIDFNDPMFNNVMWQVTSGAVFNGFTQQINSFVNGTTFTQETADSVIANVNRVTPTTITNVDNTMMTFNPDTRSFDPVTLEDIADIERMKPTITQTLEIGYKGILGNKFQFSIDAYRSQKDNFVGPLTVETPNVFFDPSTLTTSVGTDLTINYNGVSSADSSYLLLLDNPAFGGNGNGSPLMN